MSKQNVEMIELGCLLVMCVYHVILYFQIRRNYYLYLGLLCFIVLVRASLVSDGSQLFLQMFIVEPIIGTKIKYLASYASLLLMPMFIYDLFTFKSFSKFLKFFQIIGATLMAFVLVTPYHIYSYSLNVYHVLMLLDFAFIFTILYYAPKKDLIGARVIFYGVVICFGFVFLEILKSSELVDLNLSGSNLVNTGFVACLFFQSLALSSIFAGSFAENKKLNKNLDERVSMRTEQLIKSNLVKEQLIQIVSHDLRSPLSSIKSTIDLTKDETLSNEEGIGLMHRINEQVDQSLKMLDDLLSWSKVSVSTMKMYNEPVKLSDLIEECIGMYTEIAEKKEIDLHLEQTSQAEFDSDKNALKVVFRNLISNAIKFTPRGGTILITVGEDDQYLRVVVTDSGIGLSDEMKETLFEMNRKNSRPGTEKEESTGIGLALVQDLIQQNNGEITVEDNPAGKGAIFTCLFPVQDDNRYVI
ncbi:MAG: hypothetical protein GY816_23715 [Cytophagales bacterium]|nr:hypothetical protein [Cytophagales bacterium]